MENLHVVAVHYSFDREVPIWLFKTEQEAIDFIRKDYERELKIEIEENDRELGNDIWAHISDDGTFAQIRVRYTDEDDDITEWAIGDIKNSITE